LLNNFQCNNLEIQRSISGKLCVRRAHIPHFLCAMCNKLAPMARSGMNTARSQKFLAKNQFITIKESWNKIVVNESWFTVFSPFTAHQNRISIVNLSRTILYHRDNIDTFDDFNFMLCNWHIKTFTFRVFLHTTDPLIATLLFWLGCFNPT
jgi:hypothetical protein